MMLVEELGGVIAILIEKSGADHWFLYETPKWSANSSDCRSRDKHVAMLLLVRNSATHPRAFPPTIQTVSSAHHWGQSGRLCQRSPTGLMHRNTEEALVDDSDHVIGNFDDGRLSP